MEEMREGNTMTSLNLRYSYTQSHHTQTKTKHFSKRSGSTAVYDWHTPSSINLLTLALESHLCKAPKKDREHTHSRLIA